MYEDFFELKTKPFSLLPDPEFLFLSGRHSIGLSLLEYSLTGQAGFCVITGEIGSGKTTLIRAFLGRVGREFTVGLISNTHASISDVAAWALIAFGQRPSSTNAPEVYQELMSYLISEYGAGRQCILVIDEAQNLTVDALEEIRLLSNINSGKDLLLQIVLVGQPELLDKLRRPELRQFAQRIAISHHLSPLSFADTRSYIEHRLAVAGSTRPIFSEMALGAIQYFSGGVPRLINSICDLSMVYAFADGTDVIDEDLVFRVIADRQVSGIAPFHKTNPADDPAIRAEINNLARSAPKDAEPVALQPIVAAAPAPVVERPAAIQPAPRPAERISTPKQAAEVRIPAPVVEVLRQAPSAAAPISQAPISQAPISQAPISQAPISHTPISQAPTVPASIAPAPFVEMRTPTPAQEPRMPAPALEVQTPAPQAVQPVREPTLTLAANAGKVQQQGTEDYYFGMPEVAVEAEPEADGELLLTEIAEPLVDSFDGRFDRVTAEDETMPRLNGVPRELRLADVQQLADHPSLNGNARTGGDPYRSTNRHNVPRELRAEESSQLAGNSGTLEPSQRSWWRRAFRRGN